MRLLGLLPILAFLLPIQAAILAIDYGAEFTKLSLVKPGLPFDVLLDKDSKRKISSVVSWKREDRVFGQEAKMAVTRFPSTHFPYVKPLLAATSVDFELDLYPNPPSLSPEGTLIFPHPLVPSHVSPSPASESEVWTPTALLAHQIAYFRSLAEGVASPDPISQVVVTVPSWWNQQQRRAYRDALELQGLQCLAMIGEGTGVALNYAMTRSFPTFDLDTGLGAKEYHIVYDSGALQTTATVLALYQTSYLPSPKSKMLVNTTHVDVLGVGWEAVGGVHLDLAVLELLVEDFIARTGKNGIRDDKRAMAKLTKEAVRVKHILSANQESSVSVESLFDDLDFRSHLSRTALEDRIAESLPKYTSPIDSALSAAGIPLSDVSSVILFGGNTRVPFVHSAVRAELGDERIAQNVNTDEAAVLGAAFYGAGLSRQFKMKAIDVTERSVYDISVGDNVVFPSGSLLGGKKSLVVSPEDDLSLHFTQNNSPVLAVSLIDVAAAVANFSSPSPAINVTVRLDARGVLSIANAILFSNETVKEEGGVAGAFKGLFGKSEELTTSDNETETIAKVEKVAIKFREQQLGVNPLTGAEKRQTQSRLISIATYEAAMRAREEARNMLEGYLYRLSNLLSDDADNKALHDFSTESEREAISALLGKTFEWLNDEAEEADVKALIDKRAALELLETPIIVRFTEWRTRGKAIDDFQKAMFAGRAFLIEATKNNTEALEAVAAAPPDKPAAPPKYTESELQGVKDLLKEYEVWMDALMEIQVQIELEKTKDPVIFTKDLDDKGKILQATVMRLTSKKQPRAPRPPKAETSTSSSASSASSSSTASPSASASESTESEGVPKHEEL